MMQQPVMQQPVMQQPMMQQPQMMVAAPIMVQAPMVVQQPNVDAGPLDICEFPDCETPAVDVCSFKCCCWGVNCGRKHCMKHSGKFDTQTMPFCQDCSGKVFKYQIAVPLAIAIIILLIPFTII